MKKVLSVALLFMAVFMLVSCQDDTSAKQDGVQNIIEVAVVETARSSEDCIGQDYQLIFDEFEKSGFSNVHVEAIEDLTSAAGDLVGTVESISIDGSTGFSKGQTFDKDSSILIRYHDYRNCMVSLHIDFNSNLLFNTYDVELWIDDCYEDTMSHGEDSDFEFLVKAGSHMLSFVSEKDSGIDGSVTLVIDGDTNLNYQIACYSENVVVREISVEVLECFTSDHAWVEATCTDPNTCVVCGKTDGNALGHAWVDATCTLPKTCSICKETKGEPNGHNVSEWTELEVPTCGTVGERTGFCNTCKEDVKEAISATGDHVYNDWKIVSQSTCTDEGKKTRTCKNCQHEESTNIEMISHDYVETVINEATYYAAGSKGAKCSSCGDVGETIEYYAYYETSLGAVFDAYRANEIAADDKYLDMFVQFTAKIDSIEQGGLLSLGSINFEVDNGTLFEDEVECKIKTSEQLDYVKSLSSGNYVMIKGKVGVVYEETLNWRMTVNIMEIS